ncbi:MAG: DUF3853 family protein [Bacteroidia bacterium]|nr:DUF3853 family protein [Bacteroidia bacterium]
MSTEELLAKPLFSLTVGEFLELQRRSEIPVVVDITDKSEKYVYGINGLAKLFNCSKTTAGKIKASGRIDKAVSQMGKTIVINADLAIELARQPIINRRKAQTQQR